MLVPKAPALARLEHITPSIYEASLSCSAKAAWYSCGELGTLPEHPAAILGLSFHAVVAAAHRGELAVTSESDRSSARQLFDETVQARYLRAHPLIRLKFASPQRLPYYNFHRERTALLATRIASSRLPVDRSSAAPATPRRGRLQTESRLRSRDGMIVGRPDHLDSELQVVVDYKSGHVPETEAHAVSEPEARQLRLYAFLAIHNGIRISKGAIIRADGRRCEMSILPTDAEAEANKARAQLQLVNAAVNAGAEFSDLASPSAQNCHSCPCIPFCDSFWTAAKPEWQEDCGLHAEGRVLETETRRVQGVSLTTLTLAVHAGTVASQPVSIEQIPSEWITMGEQDLPRAGAVVRVVHGRLSRMDGGTTVIRPDRLMTAVWFIPTGAATPPHGTKDG